MLKVVSFRAAADFAAFRDPSVTSNQTVYYIPSKTALIGMLGSILGIERGHGITENYSKSYLELFGRTSVGIRLDSTPEKISFFTNHRSLKEPKTKPFKTELLLRPRYTIFVSSDDYTVKRIFDAINGRDYAYPPYFGHAYCPATLEDPSPVMEAIECNELTCSTSCVVLDESETFDESFSMQADPEKEDSSLIIERHLHHFVENDELNMRVLRHWIPTGGLPFRFTTNKKPKLSRMVRLDHDDRRIICLY